MLDFWYSLTFLFKKCANVGMCGFIASLNFQVNLRVAVEIGRDVAT